MELLFFYFFCEELPSIEKLTTKMAVMKLMKTLPAGFLQRSFFLASDATAYDSPTEVRNASAAYQVVPCSRELGIPSGKGSVGMLFSLRG